MKKDYSSHKHSKWTLLFLFLCIGHSAKADYPIFWQRYTADPSGIEYNGRLYLFCSHDTYNAERGYGYFMNDITCISTDDMKNWTDHGEVFHAKDSKWGAKMTWAPCVVHRNGKFYLYYGDANSGGVGVAICRPDPILTITTGLWWAWILRVCSSTTRTTVALKTKKECRGPYRVVRTGGCGALIHVCL